MIRIKRVYEPAAASDGQRILVERLWPRGLKKEELHADAWLKDIAPSTELRQWYGHRVERWPEFQRRYRAELDAHADALKPLRAAAKKGTVTLLFSARDEEHNSAVVLRDYLASRGSAAAKARTARGRRAASRSSRARARRRARPRS